MTIQEYIDSINQRFKLGNSTEHTFRGDLQQLIESIVPEIRATNEPKRQACGAPDYIITKGKIDIGFIETKNIGNDDLDGKKKSSNKEQFDRYKASLTNIIFSDYMSFHLYQDRKLITKITIAEVKNGSILSIPENFKKFVNIIKDFCTHLSQTITSPKKLAQMMAGKARLLSNIFGKALISDVESKENSFINDQFNAFKNILIHSLTPKEFADVYAQTIAYGMFAARFHDSTLENFTRQEAAELIPKSNPFLRKLFGYIAGPDIDIRIIWIVDNLAEIFLACNVRGILLDSSNLKLNDDPIIHFYETFLAEYDPKLRKSRGVWYTPLPVVNFIVRAVDSILKTDFTLKDGLSDKSKIKRKVKIQHHDKRFKERQRLVEKDFHKVQILDPAAGTGTFLVEIIKHVQKGFVGQEGIWNLYLNDELLPRLHGFELLMASYTIAHLKIELILEESGLINSNEERTRIYLTNTLEKEIPEIATVFDGWLSDEANQANDIKRDTPVMVVMGNPPYSVSSSNKSAWIQDLLKDYKKDLNERNIQPLSDDYIKFIRYGQHFIEKNGSGILAYISNNSFIDGIIHRQMRKHLLETFDKIYILDLHGSSKKKETHPDGSVDQNVFDIMQGVSINIFVKKTKSKKLGQIKHYDLYGKRQEKYDFLNDHFIDTIKWIDLENKNSEYFFVPKDFESETVYKSGFLIGDLFNFNNVGFTAARDNSLIHIEKENVSTLLSDLSSMDIEELRVKHKFGNDSRDWTIKGAIEDILSSNDDNITKVNYRPFDLRFTHYSKKSKGFLSYPRWDVMKHFYNNQNLGLVATRVNRQKSLGYFWVTNTILERHILDSAGDSTSIFPLYLYPDTKAQQSIEQSTERTPNLNMELVEKIANKLGLEFIPEKEERERTFAPIDLLDYIYAVLHSPTYREKYKEFLKIDFPRVPYPKDKDTFWKLVKLGGEIRQIHLLESPVVEDYITEYPIGGDNTITTKIGKKDWEITSEQGVATPCGRIWINEDQYFDKIPVVAWNFYIGGYQPAQKWLKDRKGRTLEFEDILHYQKIIVALTETDRLMKEIDKIEIEE